jgi:hypothetical protein
VKKTLLQLFCTFFAQSLIITNIRFTIASLNRDKMNELIILTYFLVAMIPVTGIAWLIENKIKNFDK